MHDTISLHGQMCIFSFNKTKLKVFTWSLCQHLRPVIAGILLIIQFITNVAQCVAAQRVHQLKTLSAIMCFWAWKWGTIAWKNVIFKNNPFPLNNAISKPFPVYSALWDFRCESICHGFHRCIKQERQTSSENKCQFSKFCPFPPPPHPPFKKTTEFDYVR